MAIQTTIQTDALDLSRENIRKLICPSANDTEIALFLEVCKTKNLNPFLGEIYLIKYGSNKAQMVVGKDAFTQGADKQEDFLGFEAGIVVENDNQTIVYKRGSLVRANETLIGGWATVHRKNRHPYYEEVSLREYSTGKSNWNIKPATMIRKVALVHALREAYPNIFNGLYDQAELNLEDKNNYELDLTVERVKTLDVQVQDVYLDYPKIPKAKYRAFAESDFAQQFYELNFDAQHPGKLDRNLDYRIQICDTKLFGWTWSHFHSGKSEFLQIQINKDIKIGASIRQGEFMLSSKTKAIYGDDWQKFLDATHFGTNWIIISDFEYQEKNALVKELRKEFQ
jgi:phage recombination protein Bet